MAEIVRLWSLERPIFEREENDAFIGIELAEIETYLSLLPTMISQNLRRTYKLPEDIYQFQQTNGFLLFKKGRR